MNDLGTKLDRYGCSDEARIKAKWFTYRTGNQDVWEVLGLVEPGAGHTGLPSAYRTPSGYFACRICKRRTRADGVCRRSDCHRGAP